MASTPTPTLPLATRARPRARSINYPRGNSGDPASPHWDDTLDDWVNGVHRPLLFRTVEADSTEESVLSP